METDINNPDHELWPQPWNGRLAPLILQSLDEPHHFPETSRWTRMGKPSSRMAPLLRVSYWIGGSTFEPGTRKLCLSYTSISLTILKLVVAWPLLCILVWCSEGWFPSLHFQKKFSAANGRYETVFVQQDTHQHPNAALLSQRALERESSLIAQQGASIASQQYYVDNISLGSIPSRSSPEGTAVRQGGGAASSLRPRYLCFIKDYERGIYETVKVSKYIEKHGDYVDLEFVFVSYTRRQFRVATEEEVTNYDYPDEATRNANRDLARRDRQILAKWGMDAANRAGKSAFWLDFECVRSEDGVARSTSSGEDVYRICDIVRAAHSVIIAIGPPASAKVASILAGEDPPAYSRDQVTPWIRQWGSRLWALPELLLCPVEYRILLYVLGDPSEPKAIAKRNFAERAWDDAEAVKDLVNHFEGSAILTQLNLIETALRCFSVLQTDQFSQGDIAYAVMGLFPSRQRPQVDKEDSGFQAFAKLALANDSGSSLERLICLASGQGAPWYQTEDHWGVKLSDIHPINKICAVLDHDTILLDGVYGATIRWDDLHAEPEPFIDAQPPEFVVFLLLVYLLCVLLFVFGVSLTTAGLADAEVPNSGPFSFFVWIWMPFVSGILALVGPFILLKMQTRDKQPGRPRMLGIEGAVDTARVEVHLWGFNHGTLTDATPQSYRDASETGPASTSSPEQEGHLFTLVDTYAKTLTHIRCSSPPVAMFICGRENGMHRALLCSYDWRTRKFHRQAVLRISQRKLDQFHQIDNVRLSLCPSPARNHTTDTTNRMGDTPTHIERETTQTASSEEVSLERGSGTWRRELCFLCLCLISQGAVTFDRILPHYQFIDYDNPFYEYRDPLYDILFVCSLPIALAVISYQPLSQVTTSVLMARFFLQAFIMIDPGIFMVHIWAASTGLLDGSIVSILIAFILSWYSVHELPLQFIIWGLFRWKLPEILRLVEPGSEVFFAVYMLLLYSLNSIVLWGVLGRPEEVSWLTTHGQIHYTRRAAAHKFAVHADERLWRSRKSLMATCLWLLLVVAITLLITLEITLEIPNTLFGYGSVSDQISGSLVGILVGLCVNLVPSACFIAMVSCYSISSAIFLYIKRSEDHKIFLIRTLAQSHHAVLPLLWSISIDQASTWVEAIGALVLSLTGDRIIILISLFVVISPSWTTNLVAFLVLATLFCLLWGLRRITRVTTANSSLGAVHI